MAITIRSMFFLRSQPNLQKYLVTLSFAWQCVCRCFSYVCNTNMSISLGMVPFGGVESQEMLDYLLRGRRLAQPPETSAYT